ncbi:hypothetical protein EUX57_03920 [Pseudomonas orientalis]|uniref:Uncharacterized protein n=1 Tax=Pseudomonas orientalis TaxID=76758 RepID=A0A4V2DY82_9PSED|nr:hypothetical protein EUX57_03920 [Pseudomonas orientalis]
MIVPTLCVGMHPVTLCVTCRRDAERPRRHSHAERGNDQTDTPPSGASPLPHGITIRLPPGTLPAMPSLNIKRGYPERRNGEPACISTRMPRGTCLNRM